MQVRVLDETTWPDFAALVERHNGVWGGCWCMGFHAEGVGRHKSPAQNRAEKEARVQEGRAHAALVYDGDACVGWCQFGSPEELPRIKHRRAYERGLDGLPDWRITCFFVDKAHRRSGVAAAALAGALERDRAARRRHRRELPRGQRGPQGLLVVPAQRHASRCSRPRASSAPANSASTTGSSPRSCPEPRNSRTPSPLKIAMRRAHLPLTALVVLAGLATAPAAASAATAFARIHGGGEAGPRGPVRYTAAPGEANRLTVSEAGGRIVFSDAGARVLARGDCEQLGPHAARCPFSEDVTRALLGDGDDRARITGSPFLVVHGGTGADVLAGGRGGDQLEGDSGADTLRGGRGADTLTGGTGRDRVFGGSGDDELIDGETDATSAPDLYRGGDSRDTSSADRGDTIDYSLRRRPLRIDLGRRTSNTGDRILGLESITGGRGDDHLTGDGDDNWLEGERGDDVLRGGGGRDIPLGGAGDDDVRGGDGDDVVWGNGGANRLSGGAGDDLLEAGGRAGDRVGCGAGSDVVVGNRPDTLAGDCERSSASSLTVSVHPALTPAAATFEIGCSGGGVATRCRGTIALAAPDGTLYGQAQYSVIADGNAPPTPVTVPLTAAGSAALQSRRLVAVTYGRRGGYRTELGPIGP